MATYRRHRQAWPGLSEYTGEFRENTLPAKQPGAPLDAQEKMRLMKLTGTVDILAEPDDRRSWEGYKPKFDSQIDLEDR